MSGTGNHPGDVGAAFRNLLRQLDTLADVVDREATDPVERAEGYRHLSRLFSACEEWFLQKSDPERPAFTRVMTPWRKFIGDNPDTFYDVAPVAPGIAYRLQGHRNGSLYLGLTVYGRDEAGNIALLAQVADHDFLAPDGTFDITVGGPRPASDTPWLPVPDGAESLWVRQYFHDLDQDTPARFTLTRLDPLDAPPPLGDDVVAAAFARIGSFMTDTLDAVTTVSRMMGASPNTPIMPGAEFHVVGEADSTSSTTELETLLLKLARTSHPTPDNQYAGVWFQLDPEEALIVTGTPPPNARYWGFQLANRWQESLDFVAHQVCLNDNQIELEPDGSYRVVVSAADPGRGNWLDTAGHRNGMVNIRALLADRLDDPSYAVVPLTQV